LAGIFLFDLGDSLLLAAQPNKPAFPFSAEMELPIAKTKSLYMVIDLVNKLAILKARGVVLRTWDLQNVDWIGDLITHSHTLRLKAKEPMISPLPISPPPMANKTGASEGDEEFTTNPTPPKALTVSDMPVRYELAFDDHLIVIIQPHRLPSFWDNVFQQMGNWTNRVAAHMATWKGKLGQPHQSYLVLSMDPADAQAFYWAVVPPMAWLVFPETPKDASNLKNPS